MTAFLVLFGSVIFLLVAGGLLTFGVRKIRSESRKQEAEKIRDVLTMERHEWMNRMQILGGYMTLNQPDKSKAYLHTVIETAHRDRIITSIPYAPLAVYIYRLTHDFKNMAIASADFSQLEDKWAQKLLYRLKKVFFWLKKQSYRGEENEGKIQMFYQDHELELLVDADTVTTWEWQTLAQYKWFSYRIEEDQVWMKIQGR